MYAKIFEIIGNIYIVAWFVWPFVFVFSFVDGLVKSLKNGKLATKELVIASISMTVIIAGLFLPYFIS
ncbi:hypothetical protein JYG23_04260 [Sedimentibacter sp. zth1]|uniref:hypothetical protein n=1 Tax=Sedimentibacter sp. zth1 TaxID=2816908 RepID=UPI001A91135C|nr:hypothetical protein [Sedimentibacter sp. zth1]QSX06675.1 hypothetical protein JYG23_04260 [Sedimentibacter sp. zth1]